MSRRDNSVRLLAHSLEAMAESLAFEAQMSNPGLTVMVRPSRDFMAEAAALYEAELDKLVMERCRARIDDNASPATTLACPVTPMSLIGADPTVAFKAGWDEAVSHVSTMTLEQQAEQAQVRG